MRKELSLLHSRVYCQRFRFATFFSIMAFSRKLQNAMAHPGTQLGQQMRLPEETLPVTFVPTKKTFSLTFPFSSAPVDFILACRFKVVVESAS